MLRTLSTGTDVNNAVMSYDVIHSPGYNLMSFIDSLNDCHSHISDGVLINTQELQIKHQ